MANGYKQGDFLGQFLAQLPQLYRNKQNLDFQRERFEYMKEKGIEDEVYRSQVFQSNEERNRIARLEFEERKQKNINDENQRKINNKINEAASKRADFTLQASSFKPGSKAYNIWMLNQSHVKDNPLIKSEIENTFNLQNDLQDRIEASIAMEPKSRLEELRSLSQNQNKTENQFKQIQELIKDAREEASVTTEEIQRQPSYRYYLQAQSQFKNIAEAGRKTDPNNPNQFLETQQEFENRKNAAMNRMFSFEEKAFEKERASRGPYPGLSIPFYEQFPNEATFDNIEDIPDKDVDAVLGDLGVTIEESSVLPPELSPPERPSTPLQMDTEDSLGVPADVEAVTPEDSGAFMPARDFSGFSSEDMEKYGTQIFFDKGTNQWYDKRTMEPATISQIQRHQGKDKSKKLSKNQQKNIDRALNQIEQLKTKNIKKDILEGKINRLKNKILNIDPNYKFKN